MTPDREEGTHGQPELKAMATNVVTQKGPLDGTKQPERKAKKSRQGMEPNARDAAGR